MANEQSDIMTFRTGQSLFGLPIQNVLSIMGETNNLHCKAFSGNETLGIAEYRGVPVSVIDLAKAGNIISLSDEKMTLSDTLQQREKDHLDWLDALKKSLISDTEFVKARDPHKCTFGLWYDKFDCDDEDLMSLLKEFDAPHKKIHALADQLLGLKNENQVEKALDMLAYERITTLESLKNLFKRTREHLLSTIKPVFIYLTEDGSTPCAALRIDEIADVESVPNSAFVPMSEMALPQLEGMKYIIGFLKLESGENCLLIDVELLTNQTPQTSELSQTA